VTEPTIRPARPRRTAYDRAARASALLKMERLAATRVEVVVGR